MVNGIVRLLVAAALVTVGACGSEGATPTESGAAVGAVDGEPIPAWATATALPADPVHEVEQSAGGDLAGQSVVVDMTGGGTEHLLGTLESGETDHYELLLGAGGLSVAVQDGAGAILDATIRDDGTILASRQQTFEAQLVPGQHTIDLIVTGTAEPSPDYFLIITFAPE